MSLFFFFSSRRRHTRFSRDWSSDVCSSDLTTLVYVLEHDAAGSKVHTVFDAFFFTTVQLLTVSSQLPNPVTTGGRIVDMLLEVWAVIVVAGSAGAIASFFADDPRSSPSSGSTMD